MNLRVPTSTTYGRLERGLATSLARVEQLQGELASGSRIARLSDDPVGAATGMRLRAQETDWSAYQRTADDASAVLGTTDTALQTASTLLRGARSLAVSAVNGALGGAERAAIAGQIADLRDQLGEVANTRHLGRAVFGGHRATAVQATGTPPTHAYVGDAGRVSRQVSPQVTVTVNLDGADVFGFTAGAGGDVFSVLTRLEAAIRAGDRAAMATGQGELLARAEGVGNALGKVGALMNRVDAAREAGQVAVERVMAQRSQVEDVDLAAAILRLRAAESGYQAALGAVARADLPSLASFLR